MVSIYCGIEIVTTRDNGVEKLKLIVRCPVQKVVITYLYYFLPFFLLPFYVSQPLILLDNRVDGIYFRETVL